MVGSEPPAYASASFKELYVGFAYDLTSHTAATIAGELGGSDARRTSSIKDIIESFLPAAKTLVVELDYFDIDYRSEFSASHETSFASRDPSTRRVHFFGRTPPQVQYLVDLVSELHEVYLGYAILRPQFPGTLGRALITPSGSSASDQAMAPLTSKLTKQRLAQRIRTAVPEVVELFGVTMRAVGVPYMEQDAHLLRCAHVSAWICHFTAVLRGRVPRRVSSAFHFAEDDTGSYGRQYPSHGLSTNVLSRILRRLDLPPEIIDIATLAQSANSRKLDWYHRKDFKAQIQNVTQMETDADPGGETDADTEMAVEFVRLWTADALTSAVCRYLNSGIPVILADDAEEHTQVVCGYLRDGQARTDVSMRDGSEPAASAEITGGVEAFIVQDDGAQPFSLLSIKGIVDQAIDKDGKLASSLALVVPLPRGLWLSGTIAEQHGAEIFKSQIVQRAGALRSWASAEGIDAPLEAQYRQVYDDLLKGLELSSNRFSLRSYVLSGSELKLSINGRVNDKTVSRVLGYTRLPKFVWVVEVIERSRRTLKDDAKCVVGTVALDASVVSESPDVDSSANPIFLYLPGQVYEVLGDLIQWRRASLEPYETGRWRHDAPWYVGDEMYYLANKGAQARA